MQHLFSRHYLKTFICARWLLHEQQEGKIVSKVLWIMDYDLHASEI